ncbi:hypothetical protein P153DRAFT_209368 [Dothidotthia symphoricarpi CBS 119687]|uniref:Uncharacterized protein n=1 Tax=Dothidotthia symphoricarpi CBS 119687 TaxID=1392245 RepID=A0A6A6AJI4_9PLEO|nr:uncharacterized protein P153DRAFT_209368 [Dothidotthia symphoricarpi CBS 119687]KAF2131037.1 hypothetical protein P153DRAFT_209368 [Dothidotthia symphoricarpi CBS 119687]
MAALYPPVVSPATRQPGPQHQRRQSSSSPAPNECNHIYNEKDACERRQSVHTERGRRNGRGHDSVISYPFSPCTPSPHSSISSAERRHHSGSEARYSVPVVDGRPVSYPPQAHLDPEKNDGYSSPQGRQSLNRDLSPQKEQVHDRGEYEEGGAEEKAWQLLFYLSGPCALLSVAITFWTIAALIISLALYPLRFCSTRPSLSSQLESFLAPALNLQLHLVYSTNSKTEYSAPLLVVIHLFSPFVAFGIAIAAWVAACFSFFSAILGDPGGPSSPDGHHNDGKESILSVRNWWEKWLARGLR